MITVNSLSGGQTSSYIAANYPADFNVFALVRTSDPECIFPDEKIRQIVSDKIGTEFIGTLEDDMIIYTILDLEQYIGKKIDWVTGKTFDEVILRNNGKRYLPSLFQRFCTVEMKLVPLYSWWKQNFNEPIEMRIGYRANELRRVINAQNKTSENGFSTFKDIVGFSKNGRRKWQKIEWQKQVYPLVNDNIFKDKIVEYWKNKPVRFAKYNNCAGCFHRNLVMLNLISRQQPNKFDWFSRQENTDKSKTQTFIKGITYERIRQYPFQQELSFDDFTECDSGYCGL